MIYSTLSKIKSELKRYSCLFSRVNNIERVMQSLIHDTPKSVNVVAENIIWFYWNDGLEHAPEVVKIAHSTWVNKNRDKTVIVLNDRNIENILGWNFNQIFSHSSVALGAAGRSAA